MNRRRNAEGELVNFRDKKDWLRWKHLEKKISQFCLKEWKVSVTATRHLKLSSRLYFFLIYLFFLTDRHNWKEWEAFSLFFFDFHLFFSKRGKCPITPKYFELFLKFSASILKVGWCHSTRAEVSDSSSRYTAFSSGTTYTTVRITRTFRASDNLCTW